MKLYASTHPGHMPEIRSQLIGLAIGSLKTQDNALSMEEIAERTDALIDYIFAFDDGRQLPQHPIMPPGGFKPRPV